MLFKIKQNSKFNDFATKMTDIRPGHIVREGPMTFNLLDRILERPGNEVVPHLERAS